MKQVGVLAVLGLAGHLGAAEMVVNAGFEALSGEKGVAEWSWWIVLTPFALAAAWWQWADWSGYTKRKEMEKMDDIKRKRLLAQRDALKRQPGNERRR